MGTEETRKENIERVLDEALAFCEEKGIAAINQTNLAKNSNISTKSIRRYFTDKTEIIYRVSQKLITRWYREIDELFLSENLDDLTGVEGLELFLRTHNTYLLKDYKGLVFVQDADIFCRYHENAPDLYWKTFRKASELQSTVQKYIRMGLEDESITDIRNVEYTSRMITTICSGFVEHLACDLHCKSLEVEEAIGMSNRWIDQLILYLKNSSRV